MESIPEYTCLLFPAERAFARRGTVKWLRVVEAPSKLFRISLAWNIDATQTPAMNWNSTNNKRILGTVPVEAARQQFERQAA